MQKINKKEKSVDGVNIGAARIKGAFTLVELIVVITILAILGTIAFLAFKGFSRDARDSVRMTDLAIIEKSLELNIIKTGTYPIPTGGVQMTYSGAEIWTQGTIGNTVITNLSNLSKKPLDPLTGSEYTYSRLNTKREFQLSSIFEGSLAYNSSNKNTLKLIPQTYAALQKSEAYVKGNYNGLISKVNTGSLIYVLALPSIISLDISLTGGEISKKLMNIVSNKLVYKGYGNLPSSYTGTNFDLNGGFTFGGGSILLYSGLSEGLKSSNSQLNFLRNLQKAYVGSSISNSPEIRKILNYNTLINFEGSKYIAQTLINKNVSSKIKVTSNNLIPKVYDSGEFVTIWDVGIDIGISGFNNLKLPLKSTGNYNFTVKWGDGTSDTITTWNQIEATHNYSKTGIYEVIITGTIDGFGFSGLSDNLNDGDKLLDIAHWGTVKLTDGGQQFANADNLYRFSASDTLDTSNITNMSYMFYGDANFIGGDLSGWNTSSVTNMLYMFVGVPNFTSDLSLWDVSKVTNMSRLFSGLTNFTSDLSGWNVSSVTDMREMFNGATSFTSDLSGWNTANVTNMSYMFFRASNFNSNLSGWNTANVTNMSHMFREATSFIGDISTWNTLNVTNMSYMFYASTNFNGDLSGWNTSSVTNMLYMFVGVPNFTSDLSLWDVSKVTNMSRLFSGLTNFTSDLSGWNVSSVTDMREMFNGATSFTSDLSGWNVNNVTNMSYMFFRASNFNSNLSGWNTANVTNMAHMFREATSFIGDISTWNTINVTDMSYMFYLASSFNINLSGWNTSNVTNHINFDNGANAWSLPKPNWP